MPVDATIAESSPATPDNTDILSTLTPEERSTWRTSGKLPEPKKAESAPAKEPSEPAPKDASAAEPAPASDPEQKKQEPHRGTPAPERVKELLAERAERDRKITELERQLSELKTAPKQDSRPAKTDEPQAPPSFPDWKNTFKPKEWVEQYAKEHPEASYEEATFAMTDHVDTVREFYRSMEAQRRELQSKVEEAKSRYPEADKVLRSASERLYTDPQVPAVIKAMLGESDILPDVLYVLGEKPAEFDAFIELCKTQPGKALRKLALIEHETRLELSKPKDKLAETKPEVTEKKETKAPVPKEPAPKPPAEVGGRQTSPDDPEVAAAQSGFTSQTKAAWNRSFAARQR